MSAKLPTDAQARKNAPMDRGLLRYFPRALAYVAEVSRIGNEQHNPGQPMHWAKEKSTDHGDCIVRHQCDAGTFDKDKVRHSGKVAWRALAQLELELEEAEKIEDAPIQHPDEERQFECEHHHQPFYYDIEGHQRCGGCGATLGQEDPPA